VQTERRLVGIVATDGSRCSAEGVAPEIDAVS
jgi:hypothetical protein